MRQFIALSMRLVHYVDLKPGISRLRRGKAFAYRATNGDPVKNRAVLKRIRSLAIPPAWSEVWISPLANGHLQATGRDARNRKQYIYHPAFRAFREAHKFRRLVSFASVLPKIRHRVSRHMALSGLPREKVLATVVHLLETTHIRIGNEDYARSNHSYGLTTLRNPHVHVNSTNLRFHFRGKSGKTWRLKITDRRVAKIVRACQELPGQHLFQYVDDSGAVRDITSADVNEYLQEIGGRDVTAKDFRTWSATVLAASILEKQSCADDKENKQRIKAAIAEVAESLGNTETICRKCYVHPAIMEAYSAGKLVLKTKKAIRGLDRVEGAVKRFLETARPRGSKKRGQTISGSAKYSGLALQAA